MTPARRSSGGKRHIAVDTGGRLLMVNLTAADISDSAGAETILEGIRKRWPWVKHLLADGAYERTKLLDKAAFLDFVIEVIKRNEDQNSFRVLPRRWVVERTFGWMTRWRRLVRIMKPASMSPKACSSSPSAQTYCAEMLTRDFPNGLSGERSLLD